MLSSWTKCCPGSLTEILVVKHWSTPKKFGLAVFWFSKCQVSSSSFLLQPLRELQIYCFSYKPACSYTFLLCNTCTLCSSVIDPLPIVDHKGGAEKGWSRRLSLTSPYVQPAQAFFSSVQQLPEPRVAISTAEFVRHSSWSLSLPWVTCLWVSKGLCLLWLCLG